MTELWKPIKDNPDYWISNHGRVFSFKSDKFLKPVQNKHQYNYLNIQKKTSGGAR